MPVTGGRGPGRATSRVGRVTSATPYRRSADQPALALGPLARSVEPGATVEVDTTSGGRSATGRRAPVRRPWPRLTRRRYDVLGVDQGSVGHGDPQRLSAAGPRAPPRLPHQRLVLGESANERQMQRINEAWAVLGNADRRRAYDERSRVRLRTDRPGTAPRQRPGAASYDFRPIDDGPDIDYAAELDDTPVAGTSVSRVAAAGARGAVPGRLGACSWWGPSIQLAALVAVGIIVRRARPARLPDHAGPRCRPQPASRARLVTA